MISSSIKIRTMSVLGLALAIIALLIVNLTDRIGQVPVPDDGVSWRKRGDAIEATSIRPGSAADRAGLIKGDHLKYINLNGEYLKVEDLRDVYFVLEEKIGIGGYVTYTIEREIRDGQKELWDADLKDVDPEPSKLPFELYLAAVGVIFLLVGIYVLIKQPSAQYTIHFYFVCLSVFSVYSLSSLGTFSLIDSLVLLIDSTGFIFLAPLFLHFCLRFPFQREILQKKRAIFFIYLPAAILVGLKTGLFLFSFKTPALLEWLPKLSSLEVSHFTIAFVVSTVILLVTFLQTRTSVLRQ
ncbi:MAG: hypothetical protein JNN15_10540, partial [Blastocatellia bacterium]|nr:hypothetical protein [Blastocatellia bacterium]